MLTEDLYIWLMDHGYNQLATDVNRAAGLYADALADEFEESPTDVGQPEDVPEDVLDPQDA